MAVRSERKRTTKGRIATTRSAQSDSHATRHEVNAVVGIGASAGGLEALEGLFSEMPADTGMAFVVVTHLHPEHTSLLPELLGKIAKLPVVVGATGLRVEANHIYVGPQGGQLSIQKGQLQCLEKDNLNAPKMPINYFLRSLALDQRERAICIILSGTGTDGTLGLQEIKAQAGMVIVQDPQSAKFPGMPDSAIATKLADFVLPPSAMPEQLVKYGHALGLCMALADEGTPGIDSESLQEIFNLIRQHVGHDFSAYKSNTIYRRIARRMGINHFENSAGYVRYLRETPEEINALFRDLLINVTNFFRDPEAWEALAQPVADLVRSRPAGSRFRVWVPGCASGEEVFSVAIMLHECMQASERKLEIQIFGTDLDARAIQIARAGRYPEGVIDNLTPERLKEYFTYEKGNYRIRKDIRDMAIFAVQNIIMDPPFTQIDLISCRNLLIYLNADIQKKLLPIFHYALKPEGLLILGSSESIGPFSDLFEPLNKQWRIFRRRKGAVGRQNFPLLALKLDGNDTHTSTRTVARQDTTVPRRIERALLGRFAPASAIVNERGDILYIHGHTGDYLQPSEGEPRNNILEMAREGLQTVLTEALREMSLKNAAVVRNGIRLSGGREASFVDLSVERLGTVEDLRSLILVSFRPTMPPAVVSGANGSTEQSGADDDQFQQMQRAINFLREMHQEAREELETSNEELAATNEELQSTNEELETSKEEMQSLNEELTTVNSELQMKLEELSKSNDDMQNLLNSTKIATVFLDSELNIKRFTKQAQELVMLRDEDVGRPITDLVSKLQHEDLGADCRSVLKTLVFMETEVSTGDGGIYLMRIMPYRTASNAIDGLVLTFVEISRLKQTQNDLLHMSKVFQEGSDPIIIVDLKGDILDLNDEMVRAFGYDREELLGKPLCNIVASASRGEFEALLNRCRDGESVRNVPWLLQRHSGGEVAVRLSLTVLTGSTGEVDAIAFTIRIISEETR